MAKSEQAIVRFEAGYNCAQSVFYAFCEDLGLDADTALKIAGGFGAGMGRNGEVCGAVTGGILAIGAKYGRGENGDPSAREVTYAKTKELMDQFKAIHGTCLCRELLNGCDLTTEEGRKSFQQNSFHAKVCKPCVQSAVEIVESIL